MASRFALPITGDLTTEDLTEFTTMIRATGVSAKVPLEIRTIGGVPTLMSPGPAIAPPARPTPRVMAGTARPSARKPSRAKAKAEMPKA